MSNYILRRLLYMLVVLFVVAVVLVWFAFGKAAEKAAQDRQEVHRAIGL